MKKPSSCPLGITVPSGRQKGGWIVTILGDKFFQVFHCTFLFNLQDNTVKSVQIKQQTCRKVQWPRRGEHCGVASEFLLHTCEPASCQCSWGSVDGGPSGCASATQMGD